MKHILPFLQLTFLLVALFIVSTPQKYHDTIIVLGEWQFAVGCSQLIIALFLTHKYSHVPRLKKLYIYYWLFVLTEFFLLFETSHFRHDFRWTTIWYIIPWCIASYFSIVVFISFYSKKQNWRHEK